ncbi:MAG: hypothetical protein B7C24_11160 [Bacteroidetes bacterium 4572_77]|nr:MAG: hypothetical protein B7C24_11160 [Bacteroidetes bacterium 4572_77]
MSKSKYNVQNPDHLIEKYGADTFRLYEMFLGPLESHKPWDTKGIEGVFRFMKKFWRLYHNANNEFELSNEEANKAELKILHQTIKKVADDIERFSFNTTVSQFMICTNELTDLKCNKKVILEPLAVLISSYAPHIAEELWANLGNKESISQASFPIFKEEFVVESTFQYPVSAQKWLQGKAPRKVIVVPKRIVNIVI